LRIFAELAEELAENDLESFDKTISTWVQSYRTDSLTSFFKFVTELGDRYVYIALIVALGIFFRIRLNSWKFTAQMVSVLLLSTASNIVAKKIINRARPDNDHLVVVNSLSFPSGHSMSAMAFYGFLIYLVLTFKMPWILRTLLSVLFMLTILSIGISRIYLGVHFPSDVLAGFMGGLVWVALCAIVLNTLELLRSHRAASQIPRQ
jgi:membrane-associated phospholipid phosphatase